jgi:hypothetical protein
MSVESTTAANFITIPNEILSLHPGLPQVEVAGSKKTFISSARESDIKAWLGSAEHAVVTHDAKTSELSVSPVLGTSLNISPVGSDLWRSSTKGGSVSVASADPAADGAVLIAADGFKDAPSELTITWPIAYDLTPSNTFLIVGLVLFIGALTFNYLAFSDRKRKQGPRRKLPRAPRPPQYRFKVASSSVRARGRRSSRNNLMAAPASLLVLGLLAGCATPTQEPSSSTTPTGEVEAPVDAAPPVVTEQQLKRILAEGIENVWARHARMSEACQAGVQALGLKLFSARPAEGLTAFVVPEGIKDSAIRNKLQEKFGIYTVGGQDKLKGKIVRVGHMGYTDELDVVAGLAALEMVMADLGLEFEPGVAVSAAQRVLISQFKKI